MPTPARRARPTHPLAVFLQIALLACAAGTRADAAPSGFAYLEVPAGARASGLGGAFMSLGEGVEASFWNPAGLAAVEGIEITGAHFESFQSLRHDQFAIAGRWLGGGIAASVRALYSEAIVERDELGNEIGTFGGHDLGFGIGYGRALTSTVRVGLTARLLRERIADSSTGTFGVGGGATWEPPRVPALRLAIAVDNIGPDANYSFEDGPGEPVPLPSALQAGLGYRWTLGGSHLAASLEGRGTRGRPPVAMMGAELSHPSGAALRAGARANDGPASFTVGAGYAMSALRLDYAYLPDRLDLGDSHRISFTARF